MTDITVENIVAYAKISSRFNVEQIAEKIPELKYNPDEFSGLTLKINKPKTAVLILPSGKTICTGAKNIEDAKNVIKKMEDKLIKAKIKVKKKYNVEIQNIIVSTDIKKELELGSISKKMLLDDIDYEPKQFPGLIYKINDNGVILILFSSGKIVCTGAKNVEAASSAIETIKEKLTSLGAL